MLFTEPPVERFNLQVDVHFDGAGPLHGGRRLQGEAEIFVLNLRDGDGGADCGVEQAGGADAIDGDAGERGGLGGRGGGVGRGGDGVALADAEGGRLAVADTNLNIVRARGCRWR